MAALDDDGCGPAAGSSVRFQADEGKTYWIAVDGVGGASGSFALAIRNPPANDDFANAQPLSGPLPIDVSGSLVDAAIETGEPNHAGAPGVGSVWYAWTPATTRKVVIETCASSVATLLAVYTGSTVGDLAPVASNVLKPSCFGAAGHGGSVVFLARAGTTYRIAVDLLGATPGPIALLIRHADPPANDDFARAKELRRTLPASDEGSNVDATVEDGEPNTGDSTVWYRWTPAASGRVVVDACGSGLATGGVLAVYTGAAVDALTALPRELGDCELSRVIDAVAGETYRIAVGGFFGATGSIALTIRRHSPPANDDFANARILTGALPLSATGTNVDATTQAGEPFHGDHSVWFRWTPTVSGPVAIDTCASASEAQLGLHTGAAVDALTEVTPSYGCGAEGKRLVFSATAGTTYQIAVGGDTGPITLKIRRADRPANDDLAGAQALTGALPIQVAGTNRDASEQPGERLLTGGPSVWYRWTAPASGPVVVETCGSDFDTQLDVYAGSSFASLTRVADNDNGCGRQSRVRFAAHAGVTYRISVAGVVGLTGSISLTLRDAKPAANDSFTNADELVGPLPVTATGSNVDASREAGEPEHSPGSGATVSVWWRWTADVSGPVTVDACASDFQALLGVYTGRTVGNLTAVAPGNPCRVAFTATAGTTYRIAVDGEGNEAGEIALAIRRPPANDDINNAQVLSGSSTIGFTATNRDATKEPGEPDHAGDRGGASVWFLWKADAAGDIEIKARAHGLTPLLGVYTGSAVNRLATLAAGTRSVRFRAQAGQTYLIAVDGRDGETGAITLELRGRHH